MAAWICFHDNEDLFKKFLQKVLRLKEVCGALIQIIWIFYLCFNGFTALRLCYRFGGIVINHNHQLLHHLYIYVVFGLLL